MASAPALEPAAAAKFLQTAAPTAASVCPPNITKTQASPITATQAGKFALARLKTRSEFVRVAAGRRVATAGLVLQMAPREGEGTEIRVGVTATKRIGSAPLRNRAKRRLREVAKLLMPSFAQPGCDYVLVARDATPERPFASLTGDLKYALKKLHAQKSQGGKEG